MALLDIFKKSKKEVQKKEGKKEVKESGEQKAEKKEKVVKEQKIKEPAKRVEKKQFSEAWRILRSPQVTEKASLLTEQNNYIFKVYPRANKKEIKRAIEDLYGVSVEKVRVINIPGKIRKVGRSQGYKSGYKKAIIKLAEGEKIEIMPR